MSWLSSMASIFLLLLCPLVAEAQHLWQKPVARELAEVERMIGEVKQTKPSRDLRIVWVWPRCKGRRTSGIQIPERWIAGLAAAVKKNRPDVQVVGVVAPQGVVEDVRREGGLPTDDWLEFARSCLRRGRNQTRYFSSTFSSCLLRCVERCWPITRQLRRSLTPRLSRTCMIVKRRREGLSTFPKWLPSE